MTHYKFSAPVIHLEKTDSTSNYLLNLCNETRLEEFTSVIADFQTSGKGQRGNSWISKKGENLLFSFIFYPDFVEAKKQFYISKAVSLAIKKTLDFYSNDITIKWPNDIYWKDKKICGTLIENDLLGTSIQKSIAGIGVNINQKEFDKSALNPVSLYNITNSTHKIMDVFNSIMENVQYYNSILKAKKEAFIDRLYFESLYRNNGFHTYEDKEGIFNACIVEVLPEGFLVLKDEQGRNRQYAFKEVQYLSI